LKQYIITILFIIIASTYAQGLTSLNCQDKDGFEALNCVFCGLKNDVEGLLGPIAFLLIIMSAVIYAGGQLGDAQLRAKAQGWAVMAIMGALIAFVLMSIGPTIVAAMFGNSCSTYTTPVAGGGVAGPGGSVNI